MRAERTGREVSRLLCTAIVVALGFVSLGAPPANATSGDSRTPILRDRLDLPLPEEGLRISVVLREPDTRTSRTIRLDWIRDRQAAVFARLNRGRFTLGRRYRNISGFSGWADAKAIEDLMDDPDVLSIDVDRIAYAVLTQGVPLVGAAAVQSLGFTGSGVTLAVLDTGIDTDHPDLMSSLIAEACFCDDFPGPKGCCPGGGDTESGPGSAEDDNGHGSGSAGVIVSTKVLNLGVAPDASVVALKVLAATGFGSFSDVADGLDWVIDEHLNYGIKVVNLSVSDGLEYGDSAAWPCSGSNTANAIAQIKALGVSVFVASGNDGYDNGIGFPACVPEAFSVGGVYDSFQGQVSWCGTTCGTIVCTDFSATKNSFVCHSNSSPILDLLAPDWKTRVASIGGVTIDAGGTSIASPYAAGQAALLLEVDPNLMPDEILTWLETGAPMVTNPDNSLSFPRARVDLAVATLLAVCGNSVLEPGEGCDDGNTTSGDCCDGSCQPEAIGNPCDDTDLCTLSDVCDGVGACAGTPVVCDDSAVCTDDSCDPGSGTCQFLANTAACDDFDACTNGDVCAGGVCISGPPLVCDDSNLCTDDLCIPASGCQFNANTDPCDDANSCTEGDACSGGSCVSGNMLDCDDADACTADGCDESTGCFHEPIEGCPALVPSSTPTVLGLLITCFVAATVWTMGAHRRASLRVARNDSLRRF